jgi:hypothetical protein
VHTPATPDRSLVKRLGQQFESARRLFVFPANTVKVQRFQHDHRGFCQEYVSSRLCTRRVVAVTCSLFIPRERPAQSAVEEGKRILQNRRPTRDWELAGRRARRGYQERGNEIANIAVTMAKWRPQNHPEAAIFLISPWQGNRRGDIHLLQDNVSNWRLTTILRLRISMRPARWNSLISLETASRVDAIMFARSWCVRRTLMTVREP